MNDPMALCLCQHTRGLHWHGAGGVIECSIPGCACRQFFDPILTESPIDFIVPPRCLACNHPEKDHAHRKPNRYCEEGLCCCTNYVSSPADMGRFQRLHPEANA